MLLVHIVKVDEDFFKFKNISYDIYVDYCVSVTEYHYQVC